MLLTNLAVAGGWVFWQCDLLMLGRTILFGPMDSIFGLIGTSCKNHQRSLQICKHKAQISADLYKTANISKICKDTVHISTNLQQHSADYCRSANNQHIRTDQLNKAKIS
jgi:hypothetical protein